MKRTQIYLDEKTHAYLLKESTRRKMTVSELIRKSVRGAMDHDTDRMIKDVNAAFGAWKNRNFDTEEYLRELRRRRS